MRQDFEEAEKERDPVRAGELAQRGARSIPRAQKKMTTLLGIIVNIVSNYA